MLVVEDDASTGALLVQLIKRLWPQASVVLASDALFALEHWKSAGADLVLLDWGLPGMSGIDLLKQIRRSETKTVCVMISGHADREVILAARTHQVDAFIVKPFAAKQLMARLSELMALPSADSQLQAPVGSIEDFIKYHMTQGILGLPIDPELAGAIEGIRELDAGARAKVLRQCQFHPALVFRALSLANSGQYIQGLESVETFEGAIHQVGLAGFINLAVEMSLHPGSELKADFLKTRRLQFHRDCLSLADIVTKLGTHATFDLAASRSACMLYRVGELSLLQLMQSWMDLGNAIDDSLCASILKAHSSPAGNQIKTQWNIPNTIRGRIGAAYLLPTGTVRIDSIVMRIAGLLLMGDPHQQLPRLLARVGLTPSKVEGYRPAE
ncbi:response regulator [uncultured Thiocystis sp.]|uniref:response regulator n=1 Tax=uncultured Thiocystis sp. TaxID=1202134 RepID=UPI0025DC54F6|nr:response regulator [uncultured Thiocystis sp.]